MISETDWSHIIADEQWGGCGDECSRADMDTGAVGGTRADTSQVSDNSSPTSAGTIVHPLKTATAIAGRPSVAGECALGLAGSVCSGADAIAAVKEHVDVAASAGPTETIAVAKKELGCETEECVLRKVAAAEPDVAPVIDDTLRDNFKPSGPADSTTWLNNDNIDHVLDQLAGQHDDLYHMPFHMINFIDDPRGAKLAKLDMCRDVIKAGFKTFAVVLNTDTYGKSGTHWFCIFADFRRPPWTIEYFNSSGAPPLTTPTDLHAWLRETVACVKKCADGKAVELVIASPIQHQKGTSECGVYCLYFLYKRITEPGSLATFTSGRRISDEDMIAFRQRLFRNRETNPAT